MVILASLARVPAAAASCDDAVNAAVADATHPSSELVAGVWKRVYGSFAALTGRATALVVLAEAARQADGKPFPASAFICPSKRVGETPALYVSWPLIAKAQADKLYDTDFVALVIGHELGHRARDLTFEGLRLTQSGGPSIEARADAHGAFFAAVGGFSTRRLACDAALDTFLDVEAHVGESVRAERKKQLAQALLAFDVYESLYEASAGLAFWDSKKARALLTWVDQRLSLDFTPIPEFKVLLALTILMDVAGESPWTDLVAVPGAPNDHLRCVPVFPEHTALWDELLAGPPGEGSVKRDLGADLRTAIALLNEALALGASPLAAHSALSCAHAYVGDTKKALSALEQAKLAAVGRPLPLQEALAANRAFIGWVEWMRGSGVPKAQAPDRDKEAWADALRKQRSGWTANARLTAWIDKLKAYPAARTVSPPAPLQCRAEPRKALPGEGWSRLPTCPDAPKAGGCPCGWLELHQLGDPLSRDDPSDGVRTCVPGGWGTGLRWIDVYLPLPDIKARMMSVALDAGGALASLRTWDERCQVFEPRGTSDRGKRIYAGICPDLGAPQVILQAEDCRVERALVIAP